MAGYTRQSTFADGDTITAALFNNEYNQLVNAFSNTTGHSHDGTAASGPVIGLIGDAGETSPNNKVLIDTTNNYIEFYVEVSSAPVQQLYIADGAIIPVTDSDIDLGTTSLRFKDTYTDTITTTGNVDVGGNLTVTGTTTFNGGTITMGDAATDNVVFGADVDSNIIPDDDDSYDLGSSSQEWRNLYIDGTANIDSLVADTADINGGTIDGVTIGGTTAGAVTFTDLSDGTITITAFADEDDMSSDSATLVPTQQSVKAYVDSQVTAQDLDFQGDTGGALSIDLDSESLTIAGGTGLDTVGSGNTITVNIDSTVTTLTGTQTLTNKTLTTPVISSISNTGTITLPTSTDTLVGRATTDTLTNKTIDVDNNTVSNIEVDNFKASAIVLESEGIGSNDNDTSLPTSAAVKDYVDTQITAEDLDITTDSGTIAIDLDSETLTIAGGTGLDSSATGNAVTLAIDSTVATLTGTQTLTNKTIDAASNTLSNIANSSLTNSTVSYGGVSLALGASDATPAFDLSDATNYPTSSLTGTITNAQLDGSIEVSKTLLTAGTGLTLSTDTLSVDAAQTQITSVGTLGSLTVSGDLTVDTSTLKVDSTNNRVGIGNATPDVSLDVGSNTDAIHVPSGTTAERPASPAAGYFRYNSTTGDFEGYTDAWGAIAGVSGTAPVIDTMTGDGSDTTLTLTSAPVNENATVVTIDGVVQHKDTYSVSSNILTFSEAPPTGTAVECITWVNTTINSALLMQDADGDTQIQVEESSDEDKIRFDTGGTERMIIDSSGNVGIGTTSPESKLAVKGSSGDADLFSISDTTVPTSGVEYGTAMIKTNSTEYALNITSYNANGKGLRIYNNGGQNAFLISQFGGDRFVVDGSGNVGIGTSSPDNNKLVIADSSDVGIQITKSGVISSTVKSVTTGLAFGVDTSSGNTERMRIDSSGDILMGIASSGGYKLQVAGDNPNRGIFQQIYNYGGSPRSGSQLLFTQAGVGNWAIGQVPNTNAFAIYDGRDASSDGTERMRIDSSGNVGIGTSSPAYVFDVLGSARLKTGVTGTPVIVSTGSDSQGTLRFGSASTEYSINSGADYLAMIFNTNGSEKMRITSSGNVGIGGTPSSWNTVTNVLQMKSQTSLAEHAGTGYLSQNWYYNSGEKYIGNGYATRLTSSSVNGSFSISTAGNNTSGAGATLTWSEKLRVDNSGNLLVGTTSSSAYATGVSALATTTAALINVGHINGTASGNAYATFGYNNVGIGSITQNGTTAVAYNTSSDGRLKDVTGEARGLEVINELNPVSYNWKADGKADEGLIAQEVLDIVPNAVTGSEEDYYQMDYSKLVVHLVKGMKEQQAQIDALQSEINLLKGE